MCALFDTVQNPLQHLDLPKRGRIARAHALSVRSEVGLHNTGITKDLAQLVGTFATVGKEVVLPTANVRVRINNIVCPERR